MLTKSLLKGRVLDKALKPTFITKKNALGYGVCDDFVSLTHKMHGQSYVAFKKSIETAGLSVNPYVSGLMKVIKDQYIDLEDIDYEKLRWELIKASEAERANALSYEEFRQNLEERFKQDFSKLSLSIYGDLEEEIPMSVKPELSRDSLVVAYNLALAKGFLVKAESLKIVIMGHASELKKLFMRIKFLGLFVEDLTACEGGFEFCVSGPLSMTTGVKAYGIKFVGLISILADFEQWSLEADVVHNSKNAVLKLDNKSPITDSSKSKRASNFVPENIQTIIDMRNDDQLGWKLEPSWEMVNFGEESYCFPDIKAISDGEEVRYIELFNKWNGKALIGRLDQLEICLDKGVYLGIDRSLLKDKKISKKIEKIKLSQQVTFLYRDIPSSKALKGILNS
jgi:predicted nuclease of restriction endonuclease-like RecB superfamily